MKGSGICGLDLLDTEVESANAITDCLIDVEVFANGCNRGLRLSNCAAFAGQVLFADKPVLDVCKDASEFASSMASNWSNLNAGARSQVLLLSWRTVTKHAGCEVPCLLKDWGVCQDAVDRPPPAQRLRGIAAVNAMALARLVLKPSLIKAVEAEAPQGLCVYPLGSLLNHSCLPSVNRLPFRSCLMVRANGSLPPGLELSCTYIEVRAPLHTRRSELETSWGFHCECCRCLWEERVWSSELSAARSMWRRFERRRSEGVCSEEELRSLVSDARSFTDKSLRDFLDSWNGSQKIGLLQDSCNAAAAMDPEERDQLLAMPLDTAMPQALLSLRDLLLASYWIAPAWELAFGLQQSKCFSEAVSLWKIISRVTAEVLPLSTNHAAATMEAALTAAEGLHEVMEFTDLTELLKESLRVCTGTYGGHGPATWQRLASARLQSFAPDLSRSLLATIAQLATACDDTPHALVNPGALDDMD